MNVSSMTNSWPAFLPEPAEVDTDGGARRTKIVCTLGPASSDPGEVLGLAAAGMDCARLNFSFGTHDEHAARIAAVRSTEERLGRPISLLADLCGPKIRVAADTEPTKIDDGQILSVTGVKGVPADVRVTLPSLAEIVEPDHPLLIEDGRIRTRVIDLDGDRIRCVVEVGGTIKPGKGVNVPQSVVPIGALTDKDRADLAFALEQGVDHVALSFVQRPGDVEELRSLIAAAGSGARIVSKIEKAEAVADLDAIVGVSDAVMVARGDLGVEIGVHEVPLVQKRIISLAGQLGRTVITATQMLESMVEAPEPTRAESTDVANAILDGTSAVMLSAETASGKYPVRAVEFMDRLARRVEPSLPLRQPGHDADVLDVLMHATGAIATSVGASVIAVPTHTGRTVREVSRCRPLVPVVAATTSDLTLHQLALEWGVVPVRIDSAASIEATWGSIVDIVTERRLAGAGDLIVLTGRANLAIGGNTSNILVHRIESHGEGGRRHG